MTSNKSSAHGAAAFAAAVTLGLGCASAFAQQPLSPYDETLAITLGGIINRFDSDVRFDGQGRHGTDFKLEDNALEKNLSTVEGTLSWRFLRAHRLELNYYQAKRSGTRTYQNEIDIGDETFPLGATVSVDAKSQLFDVNYRWSFLQRPTAEYALVLGLYGGNFKYDIDATGNAGNVTRTAHRSVSTTIPLPVIGVSGDWYPDPAWRFGASAVGIKAKVGDVDGHAYRIGAYGEWLPWRNWGFGARYRWNDIEADVDKSDFHGNLGWKASSVSLYAKFVW
jgi:hypothetical protein